MSAQDSSRTISVSILLPRLIFIVAVIALLVFGLVMTYSASSIQAISEGNVAESYFISQVKFAAIGIIGALILWKLIPFMVWRGKVLIWVVWGVAVLLIAATAAFGTAELGAQRWLSIAGQSFQPSEFSKIAFIMMAVYLTYNYRFGSMDFKRYIGLMALAVLLPLILIYALQRDLGTTVIIVVGVIAVLWVGDIPLKWIVAIVLAVVILGLAAVFGTGFRSDRLVFLDPWNDGQDGMGTGYQLIQSFYAFAQGGLFGVGLGNSYEKYLYLPEAETDFIYAIIGEELGMVGAVTVVILFLIFLWAGMRIARYARDEFGAMFSGSLTIMIAFQAFLNIGCVVGLLPTTGKPLPFISAGGSSLVATLLMCGFILAVSADASGDFWLRRFYKEYTPVAIQPSSAKSKSAAKSPAGSHVKSNSKASQSAKSPSQSAKSSAKSPSRSSSSPAKSPAKSPSQSAKSSTKSPSQSAKSSAKSPSQSAKSSAKSPAKTTRVQARSTSSSQSKLPEPFTLPDTTRPRGRR